MSAAAPQTRATLGIAYRCFPLVRDTDRPDVLKHVSPLLELLRGSVDANVDAPQQLVRIVFDPPMPLRLGTFAICTTQKQIGGAGEIEFGGNYPECGYNCSNSTWWLALGVPEPSNIKNREEVVPWSMAAVKTPRFFSTTAGGDVAAATSEDAFRAWMGTLLPEDDDVAALGALESVEPIMISDKKEESGTGRV